ncbi:uncharacterized protein METZ01_LOCUS504187, partial [marine metagenome]
DPLGDGLDQDLTARGVQTVMVRMGDGYHKAGDREFTVEPGNVDNLIEVFADCLGADGARCAGIVYMWPLQWQGAGTDSHSDGDAGGQRAMCAGLVSLIQGVERFSWKVKPKIKIITRGCQAVSAEDSCPNFGQATLWGIGRVMALELMGLFGGLVDLAADGCERELQMLVEEVLGSGGETQIGLRAGRRYGARLVPTRRLPDGNPVEISDEGIHVVTGGMGGLGLEVASWLIG